VSAARTPPGKAYRGASTTLAQALGGHGTPWPVPAWSRGDRRRRDGLRVAARSTSSNVARQSALRAGLPTSIAGMSVDRQCSSRLIAAAIDAKQIMFDA